MTEIHEISTLKLWKDNSDDENKQLEGEEV